MAPNPIILRCHFGNFVHWRVNPFAAILRAS